MGKIRDIYRNYNATTLKNRSSIPAATDITVNASNIDCVNIKASAVKSVLGASNYSLYALCRHTNVNKWSNFGPAIVDYSNDLVSGTGVITSSLPTVCKLGDFAGYKHTATPPGWPTGELAAFSKARSIQPYGNATFATTLSIGELEYPNMTHVAMSIWDGNTIINAELLALSGLQETATFSLVDNSFYGDTEVTVKFRLITGSPSVGDYITDPTLYDRYYIPNIADVTTDVKMEILTAIIFSYVHGTTGNDHTIDSLNFTTGDGGYVSWVDASWASDYLNGLAVTALLSKRNYDDDTWEYLGSSVIYSTGSYFASFPTGLQSSGEIDPTTEVTQYGFLYEVLIDADV